MPTSTDFHRSSLANRYDVTEIKEDEWHEHCAGITEQVISQWLPRASSEWRSLLNAGAGVYDVRAPGYQQIALDLFVAPLLGRPLAVCGRIEQMPFRDNSFDALVSVGQVLSYCDPADAISEFARVIRPGGLLVFDYPSSLGARHWLTSRHGNAADVFFDSYNESREKIWIYSPIYIRQIVERSRFTVSTEIGTHIFSSIARRLGFGSAAATRLEKKLVKEGNPTRFADVVTVVAHLGS